MCCDTASEINAGVHVKHGGDSTAFTIVCSNSLHKAQSWRIGTRNEMSTTGI